MKYIVSLCFAAVVFLEQSLWFCYLQEHHLKNPNKRIFKKILKRVKVVYLKNFLQISKTKTYFTLLGKTQGEHHRKIPLFEWLFALLVFIPEMQEIDYNTSATFRVNF